MTTTTNHNLDLIGDGEQPWGERMRSNLTIIDTSMSKVEATMWALDNVAVTDVALANTPVKANISNTQGISPCGCMSFTANRSTYSGTERTILVVASFTLDAVGNNKNFRIYLAKNGVVMDHATAKVRDTSSGSFATGALTGVVDVVTGDYIEIWVANLTDSTDVVLVDLSMSMRG